MRPRCGRAARCEEFLTLCLFFVLQPQPPRASCLRTSCPPRCGARHALGYDTAACSLPPRAPRFQQPLPAGWVLSPSAPWAFAKARVAHPALFSALSTAGVATLEAGAFDADARSLSNLAWAFAASPDARLNASICAAADRALSAAPGAAAATDVLASRRLHLSAVAGLLQSLSSGRAEHPPPAETRAAGVAPGADAATVRRLCLHLIANIGAAEPGDVGLACAAVARGVLDGHCAGESGAGGARVGTNLGLALAARLRDSAPHMDWRGVAAGELALSRLLTPKRLQRGRGRGGADAMRSLADRAAAAETEVAVAAAAASAAPALLFASLLARRGAGGLGDAFASRGAGSAVVLLVGDDPGGAMAAAIRGRGAGVSRWRRMACDGRCDTASEHAPDEASLWPPPPPPPRSPWDAVVVRLDGGGGPDGFAMCAAICAEHLRPGGTLFVVGRDNEGAPGAAARLRGLKAPPGATDSGAAAAPSSSHPPLPAKRPLLFTPGSVVEVGRTPDGSCVVSRAIRSGATFAIGPAVIDEGGHHHHPIDAWRSVSPWRDFPEWVVYPGLFGGGGLDVMTSGERFFFTTRLALSLFPSFSHLSRLASQR